jgi:hypothetical protein
MARRGLMRLLSSVAGKRRADTRAFRQPRTHTHTHPRPGPYHLATPRSAEHSRPQRQLSRNPPGFGNGSHGRASAADRGDLVWPKPERPPWRATATSRHAAIAAGDWDWQPIPILRIQRHDTVASTNGRRRTAGFDRMPFLAMAASFITTSSTKTSTSANASREGGDILAVRAAMPTMCGLDAVDDDRPIACRPLSIRS